jgi:hypothetical protein
MQRASSKARRRATWRLHLTVSDRFPEQFVFTLTEYRNLGGGEFVKVTEGPFLTIFTG